MQRQTANCGIDGMNLMNEHNYSNVKKHVNSNSCDGDRFCNSPVHDAKKKVVHCCMKGCANKNDKHSMFKFPNVVSTRNGQKIINPSNLKR